MGPELVSGPGGVGVFSLTDPSFLPTRGSPGSSHLSGWHKSEEPRNALNHFPWVRSLFSMTTMLHESRTAAHEQM